MPGAQLTETVDDSNWKAKVSVKLGPIALQFAADVARTEVDTAHHSVVLTTNARELRGRGGAQATIRSSLTELGPGHTRVDVSTEVALSGLVAQYGRGIVHDVAGQMVDKFADCLQQQLIGSEEEAQAAVEQSSKPVSGLRMGAEPHPEEEDDRPGVRGTEERPGHRLAAHSQSRHRPRRLLDGGLRRFLRPDQLLLEALGELVHHLTRDVVDDAAPVLGDQT